MIVFDNKNNIALRATRIETSYLVNIFLYSKNIASLSILPLGKIKLKQYNINSETNLFHIFG